MRWNVEIFTNDMYNDKWYSEIVDDVRFLASTQCFLNLYLCLKSHHSVADCVTAPVNGHEWNV